MPRQSGGEGLSAPSSAQSPGGWVPPTRGFRPAAPQAGGWGGTVPHARLLGQASRHLPPLPSRGGPGDLRYHGAKPASPPTWVHRPSPCPDALPAAEKTKPWATFCEVCLRSRALGPRAAPLPASSCRGCRQVAGPAARSAGGVTPFPPEERRPAAGPQAIHVTGAPEGAGRTSRAHRGSLLPRAQQRGLHSLPSSFLTWFLTET